MRAEFTTQKWSFHGRVEDRLTIQAVYNMSSLRWDRRLSVNLEEWNDPPYTN